MKAIEIKNLHKKYGDFEAVKGISFEVMKGEVFGFLGPNGAGKTTTLEIIEGLREPTSGETIVLGENSQKNIAKVKERIGVQLQSSEYFDFLSLEEILSLFASFYKNAKTAENILCRVDLLDKRRSYVKQLSGGQKQRFSVALALVNDPEIVFLDEPTSGIDPQSRHYLWEMIRSINKEGKTIILTTHFMDEAQILCDRIAIIDNGLIVACDTTANLISGSKIPYTITVTLSGNLDKLEDLLHLTDLKQQGHNHEYTFKLASIGELEPTLDKIRGMGIFIDNLEVRSANLEDVFMSLTGKELRE